jgi:translocation and assembly module TamB
MRWLLAVLAVLLLLVGVVAGAAWWLLYTQPGMQWAAARAQAAAEGRLELQGLTGALAREIHVERIRYADGDTAITLDKARLRMEIFAFLGGRAGIRSLQAEALEVRLAPGDGKPPAPPRLPVTVRADRVQIARIAVERGGMRHVIEQFDLRDAFVRENGAVEATVSFRFPHERYPAIVALKLGGTLERLEAAASGSVADVPASAKVVLTAFADRPLERIDAEAGPIDLRRLDPLWPVTALTLKLSGKAAQDGAVAGVLSARNARPGPLDRDLVPFSALDGRFSTDFAVVALEGLTLRLVPGGTAAGTGEIRAGSARFDLRVTQLDLRSFRSSLRHTSLAGRLKIALAETQSVQGTLSQDGMTLSADVLRKGEVLEVRSLRAAAEGGEATGTGRLRLAEPMTFEARLKLTGFDPARFGEYPAGTVNGSLDATGALGQALRVDVRWLVQDSQLEGEALSSRGAARITRGRATQVNADTRLGGARFTARGAFGRAGDALDLELEAPRIDYFVGGIEGTLRASGRLTGTWDSPQGVFTARAMGMRLPNGIALKAASAKATGGIASHTVELALQAEGLDLEARLRGGWRKAGGWSGELQALRNAGRYPMELTAPAALRAAPGRVEIGRVDARLAEGRLTIKELAWSEKRLRSSGEFSGLPAQWLILAAGLTERLRSTLLVDGHWSLASTPRLTGSASLRRASGDLSLTQGGPIALGLEKASVDARFTDGRVHATVDVASRYATAALKGEVAPEPGAFGLGIGAQSPISFQGRLSFVELRVLTQTFLTDARLDGRIGAELRGGGTLGQPTLTGTLSGDAIAFDVPPYGVFLKNGELRAMLEGDSLRVTQFSIQAGDGRLTATGTLPLRLADGARLTWRAERFGVLERPDLRLTVSGSGEATMANKKIALAGSLRADRGYLELEQERLPQLGDDVVIVGREPVKAKQAARVPVALDVQLDLGNDLEVRGYGLEGKLAGQLQVETTPEGELRAYGRIRTVNATFRAYGRRLEVDPGVAIFDGPLDNPALQMTAWRRNQQVEAGVQVSGNARSPRVQLVSQPPVPEGERLSWLVLGRAPGDATKADLGLLQAAAGALLARGDRMPLDRRIAQAFGLDEISLRGSGEVADRVVAVGKRLSDRLYISYEQGLGAAASALVKLDFSLTQRVSVRAETGTSSGVGLFYRFSWD